MQGRIPGRLLAQFAPWHAQPIETRETADDFEDDGFLEEE
jgi:hypothetical protein